MAEKGVSRDQVQGSGKDGRVMKEDVARAGTQAPAPAAQQASPAPTAAPAQAPRAPSSAEDARREERVKMTRLRQTIARRLTESKQSVPHFYMSVDVELDALLTLREQINAGAPTDKEGKPAFKLSVNDFIIKACALALQQVA